MALAEANKVLLEVNNLSITFHTEDESNTALNNLNFKIRRGETIGVVGESGSGKTISVLALLRLIQSSSCKVSGKAFFDSQKSGLIDLLSLSESEMNQYRGNEIAIIFQDPMASLNPVYTCGDQVTEVILRHKKVSRKQANKEALALFDKVRLPRPKQIFKSYPHQLSGGQQQRVMIAVAIACKPSLIIADEPTTALDVTVQATVLDIFRELRDVEDTAIIFITHDLGVVAEIADKVIVMRKGEVEEEGTTASIFSMPQAAYTKGLLACRPRLNVKLKVLPVIDDFIQSSSTDGKIKQGGQARFKSVGQAIMLNYQSDTELRAHHSKLFAQKPLLEIRNLKTHYKERKSFFDRTQTFVKAVDDVSFNVYPGEILGLVGESGCGKTTLGRSILRLIEPQSGEVIFEGKDIMAMNPKQLRLMRRDMQIIFQDPHSSLNPRKTIGEAIMEPMRIHELYESEQARKQHAVELLETVNMSGAHFYRYPHEFSGGQRQRICIARTLALKPKFVICDESVSALDVSVQAQVLNLLNDLKTRYNLTYIFISHDLAVIRFIADRVLVMYQGKIIEEGLCEDIYDKPKEDYTKALMKAVPSGEVDTIRQRMIAKKLQQKS
ncbi:MAG: ABC transporter ATP-binding protein [Bernardetiaceae bacterium]|nr:ABC transporter ATP-binding protein [Bernardetiaceae bacterium]